MIAWLPPSSDGIDEYRANTFAGQLRGQLIVQRFQNKLRRVGLAQARLPEARGGMGKAAFPRQ